MNTEVSRAIETIPTYKVCRTFKRHISAKSTCYPVVYGFPANCFARGHSNKSVFCAAVHPDSPRDRRLPNKLCGSSRQLSNLSLVSIRRARPNADSTRLTWIAPDQVAEIPAIYGSSEPRYADSRDHVVVVELFRPPASSARPKGPYDCRSSCR